MTKQYREIHVCESCGHRQTAEWSVGNWIRNHGLLDSIKYKFARFDIDMVCHRYEKPEKLMFVEVKQFGSESEIAQVDTLGIVDQLVRPAWNNKPTNGDRVCHRDQVPRIVRSELKKRNVMVYSYGVHYLTLSGDTPDDSDTILWNDRQIDVPTLVSVLKMDIDPHTLEPFEEYVRQGATP